MGKVFDAIDEKLVEFIEKQLMFFVGTAPLSGDGLVNVSPKGLDTFRILDAHTVAYLDLGGSGIETVAHVKENERIVVMFCAFEGPPKILRLHGRAEVHEPGSDTFDALIKEFPESNGTRTVIRVNVTRIADSCGWGVPLMDYKSQRTQHPDASRKIKPEQIEQMKAINVKSLDGLPGLSL